MASDIENKPNYEVHMNHPTANLAQNRKQLHKLLEPEKKALIELRKLHFETAQFEIELHRSIFSIEEGTDSEYHKIYEKRKNILEQFRETKDDEVNSTRPLRNFWLRVLKAADIEINPEKDEKVLQYLIDVRSKMFVDPRVKMIIEFEFEKNEYFSNRLLTKTYYIKCDADPKDVIIYDGIEITSMEGCKINWLIDRNKEMEIEQITDEENRIPSFFEYFNDHSESENLNRALLSEEIAFGFFLREKVIPKAVYFFTGEIRAEKEESSDESEHESLDEDSNVENQINDDADADVDVDDERTETADDEQYETCPERPEEEQEQEEDEEENEKERIEKQEKEKNEKGKEKEKEIEIEKETEKEKEKDEKKGEIYEFKELTEFEEDLLELLEEPEYEDAIADELLGLNAKTENLDKELNENSTEKFNNEEQSSKEKENKNLLADQENLKNLNEEIDKTAIKDDKTKYIETVEDITKHVLVSENIYLSDSKSFLRVSENSKKLTITEEMSRIASRVLLEEKVKSEHKKD